MALSTLRRTGTTRAPSQMAHTCTVRCEGCRHDTLYILPSVVLLRNACLFAVCKQFSAYSEGTRRLYFAGQFSAKASQLSCPLYGVHLCRR